MRQRKTLMSVCGADLEHGQESGVGLDELQDPRVAVVAEERAEVPEEALAAQPGRRALQLQGRAVVAALGGLEAMQGEHVAHRGLALEADEHVVADQQVPAHADDVARHAVVLGAHPLVGDDAQLGAAEDLLALLVERLGLLPQGARAGQQPLPDDLVVAAVDLLRHPRLCRLFPLHPGGLHRAGVSSSARADRAPGPCRGAPAACRGCSRPRPPAACPGPRPR